MSRYVWYHIVVAYRYFFLSSLFAKIPACDNPYMKSGHLEEVDGSLSEGISDDAPVRTSFRAGTVIPNHKYYYNKTFPPLDVLDEKEILRKRRQDAVSKNSDSSSEEEIELSAYEQMRADRVARNAERLKVLGLA